MITYHHWNIEYQSGDKAISDIIIAESVKRVRISTQRRIIDQHIPVNIPFEYTKDKRVRENYIRGYIDGFTALVASLN